MSVLNQNVKKMHFLNGSDWNFFCEMVWENS